VIEAAQPSATAPPRRRLLSAACRTPCARRGSFDRADPAPDTDFSGPPRFVTHIDDRAVAAVDPFSTELGLDGEVLDLMSSWISHFPTAPRRLVGLGMHAAELAANPLATDDEQHVQILGAYLTPAGTFEPAVGQPRTPRSGGDPLFAVWAARR